MRLTQQRRRLFDDLIAIREKRKITQTQVADAIGIHRSGISKFEADIEGSNPTMEVILRYAHAVGANLSLRAVPAEEWERQHDRLLARMEGRLWTSVDSQNDADLEPRPNPMDLRVTT